MKMNFALRCSGLSKSVISINSHRIHTTTNFYAVVKKTAAAGGVVGLGKGKKKLSKIGVVEKEKLPVETDPNLLVSRVCGSNIYATGEDVQIGPDSDYPDWLWTLNTGKAPPLHELDPNTKEYWIRVRAMGMRRNNKLKSLRRF